MVGVELREQRDAMLAPPVCCMASACVAPPSSQLGDWPRRRARRDRGARDAHGTTVVAEHLGESAQDARRRKLSLLQLATELQNVSKACRPPHHLLMVIGTPTCDTSVTVI